MIKKSGVVLSAFLLCLVPIFALSIPKQDSSIYVNDYAEVLSEDTKQSLISLNETCDYKTGGYVVIATFDFVEGDLYDYAYQVFNKWGIGDSKNNNGVLLLLDIGNENCAWIIGTGLESQLTESRCQSIIDTYFKDDFLDKKYDQAVMNTTKQFVKVIQSGNFTVDDQESGFLGFDFMKTIIIGVVIFIVIIAVIAAVASPSKGGSSRRRYHRSPPPPDHHPRRPGPPPGPGRFGPTHSGPRMSSPRSGPRPSGPRPSSGSMRSRPSAGGSAGGIHHSGGRSRGSGGTLK